LLRADGEPGSLDPSEEKTVGSSERTSIGSVSTLRRCPYLSILSSVRTK
jgi:hypothetical protein